MYAILFPVGDPAGEICRCLLTVSCTGHPPSAGTVQILFRPLMLVTKAIVVPSGDHAVPTRLRVMNSFSTESLCTSALDLLVICSGSVIAAGVASCWARVRVLM